MTERGNNPDDRDHFGHNKLDREEKHWQTGVLLVRYTEAQGKHREQVS